MNFQLPNYAPPQRFSAPQPAPLWQQGGAIANGWGAGGDGTGGQPLMTQQQPFAAPQQTQQQGQQPQAANPSLANAIQQTQQPQQPPQQGGMTNYNPSLAQATLMYPGFGSYLNRGMGGAPSVPNNGVAQPIRGPRQMNASPQFNRIAGVRMP